MKTEIKPGDTHAYLPRNIRPRKWSVMRRSIARAYDLPIAPPDLVWHDRVALNWRKPPQRAEAA